jgi:hypothetical protein
MEVLAETDIPNRLMLALKLLKKVGGFFRQNFLPLVHRCRVDTVIHNVNSTWHLIHGPIPVLSDSFAQCCRSGSARIRSFWSIWPCSGLFKNHEKISEVIAKEKYRYRNLPII